MVILGLLRPKFYSISLLVFQLFLRAPPCPYCLAPCPNSIAPCPYCLAPCPNSLAPFPYCLAPCPNSLAPCPNSLAPCPIYIDPARIGKNKNKFSTCFQTADELYNACRFVPMFSSITYKTVPRSCFVRVLDCARILCIRA